MDRVTAASPNAALTHDREPEAGARASLSVAAIDVAGALRTGPLSFEPAAVSAIVGPSGSGKSTLIGVLSGLIDGGSPVSGSGRVGLMLQDDALWGHLTARAHLELVGASRTRAIELLGSVGLAEMSARRPSGLSGGERRRLALARALAVDPAWLLLDEPMAHLDGPARRATLEALHAVRATRPGIGIVMATHHPAEAMGLADRLIVLAEGSVRQIGSPQSVHDGPVDVGVARMLGPASQVDGRIVRPRSLAFGSSVDPETGSAAATVTAPPGGRPARVVGQRYVGGGWHLDVVLLDGRPVPGGSAANGSVGKPGLDVAPGVDDERSPDGPVVVWSAMPRAPGTDGWIVL
ncbi:MAG: ATP-binding cassette domain-containing protein [Phycisphaerales bacterium]